MLRHTHTHFFFLFRRMFSHRYDFDGFAHHHHQHSICQLARCIASNKKIFSTQMNGPFHKMKQKKHNREYRKNPSKFVNDFFFENRPIFSLLYNSIFPFITLFFLHHFTIGLVLIGNYFFCHLNIILIL